MVLSVSHIYLSYSHTLSRLLLHTTFAASLTSSLYFSLILASHTLILLDLSYFILPSLPPRRLSFVYFCLILTSPLTLFVASLTSYHFRCLPDLFLSYTSVSHTYLSSSHTICRVSYFIILLHNTFAAFTTFLLHSLLSRPSLLFTLQFIFILRFLGYLTFFAIFLSTLT